MAQNSQPRVALFPSTPITWSDSVPFTGFLWVAMVPPSDGTTQWAGVSYGNVYPALLLPQVQLIPIIGGVINASSGLFYNADLTPQGSQYVCRYYDATKRVVSSLSSGFTVTASPVSLPALTITAPSTTGAVPTPD